MNPPDLFGVWHSSPFRGRPAQMLVHLAIADVVNDAHEYRFWMMVPGLAEKAAVSERTASITLGEMVDDGWLEVLTEGGGRGNPTEYRYLGNPAMVAPFSGETPQPFPETPQRTATHPSSNTRTKRARAQKLPSEDWEPSDKTKAWCHDEYPEHATRATLDAFRDHYLAKGTPFVDWDRAFRSWVRKASSFERKGPARTYL